MKKIILTLCAAALALSFQTISRAADEVPEKEEEVSREDAFNLRDMDKDGSLTIEEFSKYRTDADTAKLRKRFDRLDTNKDGKVSTEEYLAKKKK